MTAVDDHRHKSIPPTGANGIKLAHKISATQEKVQPYLRCDISCCSQRMQSYSYGQWVGKSAQSIFLLNAHFWNMKDTNGFYYFWSIWLLKWARLSCLLILLFAYRNAFQVKRFSFCSTRWPEPILRFFSLANTCVRSVQLNRVMRFCRIRIENKSIAYRYRWQCVFVRFCYCSNNRRFHTKQYNCRALKCSLLPRFQVNWIARNWIWNVSREVLSVAWIIFDYVIQMLFRCCYCQFRCQNQWQNIKIHVFARPTFWSTIRHSIW